MTTPTDPASPSHQRAATYSDLPASELAVRHAGANILQPIITLGHDLLVRYANDSGAKLLDRPADRCAGLSLRDSPLQLLANELAARMPELLSTGHDALFEAVFLDRTWLCHAVPMRDNDGRPGAVTVFAHDVSHIHAHAQRQLAAQRELTQALVREVRHRVKNQLQGVVGLLRQHQALYPNITHAFDQAITQLLAISVVYGLEAKHNEDRIYFCSMVGEIVRMLRQTYQVLYLEVPPMERRAVVGEEYAAPIALVVNELITNAIKHTPQQQGVEIDLRLEFTPHAAHLRLFNAPARLPDSLESDRFATGLNLVRSLLPIGHASLSLENFRDGVATTLTLLPPVVRLSD